MSTKNITVNGQVREVLANAMQELMAGKLEPSIANGLVRLSNQINDSYRAEVRVNQMLVSLGKIVPEIGGLPISMKPK